MSQNRSVETGVLRIIDCSHGLSDWYPARLEDNQLAEAWDIDFFDGAVCGRRNGCVERVAGAPTTLSFSLFVHTPTTNAADDRLVLAFWNGTDFFVRLFDRAWAIAATLGSAPDTLDFARGVDWASLHGKLFIATKSNANRLHVFAPDDPVIRRTGLAAPTTANFTVTNTGTGAFANTRQYRIRYVTSVATVIRRSEPSPAQTFVPSGTGAGALLTLNSVGSDPGTNGWEVEELAVDGTWYRIATVVFPESVWTDTLALSQVPINGVVSEDVGDYTLQYSAKWLTVDEDRLLLGGSHDEESKSARVSWTPLGGQVGVGNDERLPSDIDGFIDFDMLDGGGLTGITAWEGKVIVFKLGQVHQMVRSSSRLRAYLPDTLSRKHGAIPFSIVEGTDDQGLSCLYFLDPEVGPMQLGFRGLRVLCPQMQRAWRTSVNLDAQFVANVTFHAEKRQVWWHVATGPDTLPNLRWMYSVESDGLVFHHVSKHVMGATYWLGKPTLCYDTVPEWTTLIGQCDQPGVLVDYNNTHSYRAYIVTKAYQLGQLLRRFQIDSAVLEADAHPASAPGSEVRIGITCRRDFGVELRTVPVNLSQPPVPGLSWQVLPVDNSYMTEAITMQFEIGDLDTASGRAAWQIHGLTLAWSLGSPTTGRG